MGGGVEAARDTGVRASPSLRKSLKVKSYRKVGLRSGGEGRPVWFSVGGKRPRGVSPERLHAQHSARAVGEHTD